MKEFLSYVPLLVMAGLLLGLVALVVAVTISDSRWAKKNKTTFPPEEIEAIAKAMSLASGHNPAQDGWKFYSAEAARFLAAMKVYALFDRAQPIKYSHLELGESKCVPLQNTVGSRTFLISAISSIATFIRRKLKP